MKIYNEQHDSKLRPALQATLNLLRDEQGFNAEAYIEAKATKLNAYLTQSRLKSVVVAVSGGIDSAIVLGIACFAQLLPNSPIERIVPVMLPVFDSKGATNQDSATSKGEAVARTFGPKPIVLALSEPHAALKAIVDQGVGLKGEDWAAGQLVSYLRTPALYYITSLLSQSNTPGVILGTTNKDEGAYLGYFGKASDGLVDVQLISDIHKAEVFAVGKALGVPEEVLSAKPTGDMYDGRTDEEVFGAPYDFVELFLRLKAVSAERFLEFAIAWTPEDISQHAELTHRLEAMHGYNKHKYLGKSPAVHLDLWDSKVPGGWDYYVPDMS